ncbi:carbohydrate ABC transporter permease [Mobiluncus mulieris]|uniref:Inner membrane ABC transporter permease protein ycjP n=1 Tax=Mobiluncus mulieris TaxID=2052 RepID=A0A8G2M6H1_9ACTO|nr:carbohydrate ABC transporter permease [Mobiluncus mulieris]NMW60493.1 carbohydrate ABC transporter permease [Mobiluncus mulieris]NMW75658.1 carbohydrate ABC transporter permease [Mobiluncus mulieris]NMX12124.1 carbohydrate ABC transporter permease [Mobiluncus mulieris]PNL43202.1 ABC transporter permease [Mobiluncus mulieris]STO15862.1 Inner membrane ABC transporter permease protein ycjP [Mobiluncus mulieris]
MISNTNRTRQKFSMGRIISVTLLVLLGFLFIFPFIWMLASALKPTEEILNSSNSLFGSRFAWENFVSVFTAVPFLQIIINTFFVAGIGSLIACVVSVLSAYAFSRIEFRGRAQLFAVYLATLVLPMEVLVVPLYIGANSLGVVDTYAAIIMPFAFGAFGTFMLRQFILSLPRDYEEAARIDGAGQLRILISIILPLLRGPLSIVAAFAFIDYWNNFLWPLIVINSAEKATIPLGLQMFSGERGTDWGALMAASTVSVLASLIIVLAMQKQLSKGINMGAFGGR